MRYRIEVNLDDNNIYTYEITVERKEGKNLIFVNGVFIDIEKTTKTATTLNIHKKMEKDHYIIETEKEPLEVVLTYLKETSTQKNTLHVLGDFFRNNALIAPMPGKITAIKCSSGEDIDIGTELVVLEAMKMENSLTSPIKGRIKKVNVTVGESVSVSQSLIEFE